MKLENQKNILINFLILVKKVFKICDNYKICHDSGKWISYQNYRSLCGSCAHIGKKRKPFTEEHKANMRKNHADFKGENHPMFGKHLSDEHKENISKANKGRKLSDESRKNISNGRVDQDRRFDLLCIPRIPKMHTTGAASLRNGSPIRICRSR